MRSSAIDIANSAVRGEEPLDDIMPRISVGGGAAGRGPAVLNEIKTCLNSKWVSISFSLSLSLSLSINTKFCPGSFNLHKVLLPKARRQGGIRRHGLSVRRQGSTRCVPVAGRRQGGRRRHGREAGRPQGGRRRHGREAGRQGGRRRHGREAGRRQGGSRRHRHSARRLGGIPAPVAGGLQSILRCSSHAYNNKERHGHSIGGYSSTPPASDWHANQLAAATAAVIN